MRRGEVEKAGAGAGYVAFAKRGRSECGQCGGAHIVPRSGRYLWLWWPMLDSGETAKTGTWRVEEITKKINTTGDTERES